VESVLADFRTWLHQFAESPATASASTAEAEPVDLHTLLSQFIALRHEVNLQTKATRAQQEQNNATLEQLSQALEAMQQSQTAGRELEQQAREDLLLPYLKTLVDVFDALSLAEREVQRLREGIKTTLDELTAPHAASTPPRPSLWARIFGGSSVLSLGQPSPQASESMREAAERVRRAFDSVLTGYAMSLQRVERALQRAELEPIPSMGRPFDPELMEVVAAVTNSGRPPGEVIEDVRRGYR
jgi:molecular chaperone GrpE